jgi:hypothetical protein
MRTEQTFQQRVLDQLAALSNITSRPMFGGLGLYWRDTIFGAHQAQGPAIMDQGSNPGGPVIDDSWMSCDPLATSRDTASPDRCFVLDTALRSPRSRSVEEQERWTRSLIERC